MTKPPSGKGARTREIIVDTAISAFAEAGFASASIQSIADRCGLTQTAVLYHFTSKQELIREALGTIVRRNHTLVEGLMRPTDGAYARLTKHFRGNLEWGLRHSDESQVLLLVYYLGCFDRSFSETYHRLLETARARILAYLLAGKRERVFTFRTDPEELAATLHDVLLGGFVNSLSTRIAVGSGKAPAQVKDQHRRWKATIDGLCGYDSGD